MGLSAIETQGFVQEPTWISAVATVLFLLPAFFAKSPESELREAEEWTARQRQREAEEAIERQRQREAGDPNP